MSKKILIFGGSGFIGSSLTKQLLEQKHQVCVICSNKEKAIDKFILSNVPKIQGFSMLAGTPDQEGGRARRAAAALQGWRQQNIGSAPHGGTTLLYIHSSTAEGEPKAREREGTRNDGAKRRFLACE